MIIKSHATSRIVGGHLTKPIEFQEQCCVCDKYVKDGDEGLRHTKSNHFICIECGINLEIILK